MTDDREGTGRRLKHFIHARSAALGIESDTELVDRADISRDTLFRWYRGDRISPKAGEAIAAVLGLTYEDLLAARDGRELRPSDELEAMMDRAAEKAVRLVLAELRAAEDRDG